MTIYKRIQEKNIELKEKQRIFKIADQLIYLS